MPRGVITLATDFGLRDPWVGTMKGVILSVTRDVHLVDLTHEIAPHDVLEGALALETAVPFFPEGTIHLAVVDPGVGGARRALVVAWGECCFVGPDNGLFTPFLLAPGWRAFELTAAEYRRPEVSRTFHGRDVFAPAAAYLALGVFPERFGAEVTDPVVLPWPAPRAVPGGLAGEVVHVDRFGNLITSIPAGDVEAAAAVVVGGRELPLVGAYAEIGRGAAAGLVGSSRRLEIAVREGSAAAALGIGRGAPVEVRTRSSSTKK
ncbi:MAG: SAM-dependent chlorinase/fluorinase [Candidatus Rokubacteria bacterium]|nr:SAM-dependent chlorinase/fluorinase [Candidatus Rokubacteria bacterium]